MDIQQAFKFDTTTVLNIAKGTFHAFLCAAVVAGSLAGLDFLSHVQVANPIVAGLFSWLIPAGYNAVREWAKGQDVPV